MSRRRAAWAALVLAAVALLAAGAVRDGGPRTQQDRIEAITGRLACPTCAGESVRVSRAAAAESIRAEVARQVAAGARSDDEIVGFVAARFGAQVLLLPRGSGFDAIAWALPVAVGVLALAGVGAAFARWRRAAPVAAPVASASPRATPRRVSRRVAWAAAVLLVAVGAGWLVGRQVGERLPGQSLTGGIDDSTASLLARARASTFADPAGALDLYAEVLALDPDQVEALTYRGWLVWLVARGSQDASLRDRAVAGVIADLERATALDPEYADAHCFLGIVRFRHAGDAPGAKVALDACAVRNPPAEVRSFVDAIRAEVDAAAGG
ncbi:MAG: cytochrome c-type biogenesis protein CcmH [Acidimicrobiia bacterium]